jgi:hypothetical protein
MPDFILAPGAARAGCFPFPLSKLSRFPMLTLLLSIVTFGGIAFVLTAGRSLAR